MRNEKCVLTLNQAEREGVQADRKAKNGGVCGGGGGADLVAGTVGGGRLTEMREVRDVC